MAAPAQSLCSLGRGGPSLFPRGAGHDGVAERPGGGVTHHHLRSPPPQQVHQGGREANAARTPGPPAPGATPNSAVGSATRFLLGGRRRFLLGGRRRLRVEMVRGEGGLRAQRKLREGHRPQKSPRCSPLPWPRPCRGTRCSGNPWVHPAPGIYGTCPRDTSLVLAGGCSVAESSPQGHCTGLPPGPWDVVNPPSVLRPQGVSFSHSANGPERTAAPGPAALRRALLPWPCSLLLQSRPQGSSSGQCEPHKQPRSQCRSGRQLRLPSHLSGGGHSRRGGCQTEAREGSGHRGGAAGIRSASLRAAA